MRGSNPCWQCAHFDRWVVSHYTVSGKPHSTAVCGRTGGPIPEPQFGCVDWSREPGSDDEPHCTDPTGKRYEPGRL